MEILKSVVPGELYDPNSSEVDALRVANQAECHKYNHLSPLAHVERDLLLKEILGSSGDKCFVAGPFYCDYGFNIHVGENFYANYNLVILDCAEVRMGKNVTFGPNISIYTAGHPIGPNKRAEGLEFALPVSIEDGVWVGGSVSILPGVTIGEGSVIGAGSTVTRSIPAGVIAAGSPCRVIRQITEDDETRTDFHK